MNSRPSRKRIEGESRKRGGAPAFMSLERKSSNRGEAFPADAAAVCENGLAALGGVAIQEPVLPFAANLRRLILAFHFGSNCD